MKCSICKNEIPAKESGWSSGNNAQPVNNGRCCDDCNMSVVIPARLQSLKERPSQVPLTQPEAIALVLCVAEAIRSGGVDELQSAAAVAAVEKINHVFELGIEETRS